MRTLARRIYRGQPLIDEQMVLNIFIQGLPDAQFGWQVRKNKPASPNGALALAVELQVFMERDPSLGKGSQATVNMVSATPPQRLMAITSTSQEEMMGTLTKQFAKRIKKLYHKQIKILRVHIQAVPTVIPFVSIDPDQIGNVQIQNKTTETQTTTIDTIIMKTIDTIIVAISKTTDLTTTAVPQTSNKTETTQTNNQVDIVTEQITSAVIVKHILIAENRDRCLANVEHHNKIRTIGRKTRMLTKTCETTFKTAMQLPLSNKIL